MELYTLSDEIYSLEYLFSMAPTFFQSRAVSYGAPGFFNPPAFPNSYIEDQLEQPLEDRRRWEPFGYSEPH